MDTQLNRPSAPRHPARLHARYDRMVQAAGVQGRFIRGRSGRVHVIEAGEGPPVVHLHGNNTSSLSHLMLLETPDDGALLPCRPTGIRAQRSR